MKVASSGLPGSSPKMALKQKKSIPILLIPYAFSKLSNFKISIVVPIKIWITVFYTLQAWRS